MRYKNKIVSISLLIIFAFAALACQKQQAGNGSANTTQEPEQTVKAGSPTEAYKMLYAAVKAKDKATIRQLMSKGSMGLAEFQSAQQKQPIDKILENGFFAPTLAPTITEIRDERIKDNFGRIEVYNEQEKRWEDLPFIFENGSWKVAVGDIFQGTFDPKNEIPKGKSQIEMEASNKGMPPPSNTIKFPEMNANDAAKNPTLTNEKKSVEVPKGKKP